MVGYDTQSRKSDFLKDIRSGNLKGVEDYVSCKFPLNFIEKNGHETPLTAAIVAKKFDIVKYLVENEINVDYKDGKNCTPLHVAIYEECPLDILKLLINKDAGIKKQSYRQPPQKNTTGFWTSSQTNNELYYSPLHNAIWAGKLYEARQYLEEGANVCKTARNNKTPLMVAVEKGSLEAIKLLFEFGADVTMQIAFLEAITLGKIDIINFFISNKVLINCTYRERTTPLIEAIRVGNFDVVKILIENGADVNFTTDEGKYPLFEALKLNNCEITKYLISKGAKMQAKWLKHFTSQIVKNLTTMEIELKSILLGDFVHNTIVKAVETKSALVVKYLLEQGVPIDLCDKNEKSPLAVAANEGYFRIVKILVDAGADILSAQKELQEFAKQNEDFYIYYQVLKQKCKTIPTPEDSVNESSQTED